MIDKILKVLKREKTEYVAITLMILFIITDTSLPGPFAELIDTIPGRVISISLALALLFVHRVLGVITLIFIYILIHRSEKKTGTYQMRKFLPSQAKKDKYLSAINQFPVTLEEEQVQNLVPLVNDGPLTSANYKPVSGDLHDAAKL